MALMRIGWLLEGFYSIIFLEEQDCYSGRGIKIFYENSRIWVLKPRENPFSNLFINNIDEVGLVYVKLIKLVPIWRNMKGYARRGKRLAIFLAS